MDFNFNHLGGDERLIIEEARIDTVEQYMRDYATTSLKLIKNVNRETCSQELRDYISHLGEILAKPVEE